MPTETTVQHKGTQAQPKIDERLVDAGSDFVTVAQSLSTEQAKILMQLVAPLDRATGPLRIGFFSTRQTDRAPILEHLVRPAATRKVRTPEHRKVVGLRIDASAVPEGMLPWHFLIFSVIELLSESALLSERSTLSEMRNEISRLIRMYRREPADAVQPAITFAKRFQMSFPKLVLNTVSLSNSVLLIVLDKVDDADPQDAIQWLEAAQYFCNAPGSAVLLPVNELALVAKLNVGAIAANGREILSKWVTKRVEYSTQPAAIDRSAGLAPREEMRPAPTRESTKPGSSSRFHQTDVPTASATILRDALQPDLEAIVNVTKQWRATMQAVLRRTDEGVPGAISAALVAKIIALRAVAPLLFDTARYDAASLVSLERAAHGDTSSTTYGDWGVQVSKHPRLIGIFKAEPEFSSVDLRELSTALRLANSVDELAVRESSEETLLHIQQNRSGRSSAAMSTAQNLWQAASDVETHFLLSPVFVATAGAGAAVFLMDRLSKLVVQTLVNPAEGGWLRPDMLSSNAFSGSIVASAVSVGAELFGLLLAILIAVFWGEMRKQALHSISLGLVIGALASNLFDRLAYGNVLNYVHISNLPIFNLAHVALLLGALLLAFSIIRSTMTPETSRTA